mmetsp:Transcript_70283/g.206157  ORF Transcript_70283/g.206157 Transcript_70283/m.206157 type:complete len:593 (+) Transcript_70283:84-1862(+)
MAPAMDIAQLPADVQELLSEGGGFVLCDAKVCPKKGGLPIRYASQAFLNMLGYEDASECVGQSWSKVLSGSCDCEVGSNDAIAKAAEATGLSATKVAEAVRTLSNHFREVAVGLARKGMSGKSSASALAVGRRSSGEVFACELTMHVRQHPVLGWAYIVGQHHDISKEVSVAQLLSAALGAGEGDLATAAGVDFNGERLAKSCALLDGPNVQGFLNGRAGDMWQTAMADQTHGMSNHDEKKKTCGAGRSVASASTAASRRSTASLRSTSSADTEWDQEASKALLEPRQPVATCHLGALLRVPFQAPTQNGVREEASPADTHRSARSKASAVSSRTAYMDLLEDVSGSDGDDFPAQRMPLEQCSNDRSPFSRSELGPAAMTANSDFLKEVIETMGKKELRDLDFPFFLADPSRRGCPLLVCSAGFSGLTGYSAWEALGRNAAFLVCGVPDRRISAEQSNEVKKFLECAANYKYYPAGMCDDVILAEGELAAVQTHTRRSGELFRCMTLLKQVELEEKMFVIGLQARVADPTIDPEEHEYSDDGSDVPSARHTSAFNQLSKNMDIAVHVLASQFWYSAPIRRQFAISSDSDTEN